MKPDPRKKGVWFSLGGVLLLLVIWQFLSLFSGTNFLLPLPRDVLARFGQMFSEKEGWLAVIQSGERILQGVFFSAAVAVIFAFAVWRLKVLQRLIEPFVLLMKTVPIVSFILIALFFLGNRVLTLFISGLVVFPMVYESVLAALSDVDHALLEMARVFCLKKRDILRFIIVPACRGQFLAAMGVALGMAWKAGVASEVLSLAKPSIGWHLHDSRLYLDMEGLLAWTLAIVLVSFISEKLIILVLRSALSYVGRKLPEKARRVMHTAETLEADVEQKSEHPPAITIDDEQCAPQISDFLSETSHSVTITIEVPRQKHQEVMEWVILPVDRRTDKRLERPFCSGISRQSCRTIVLLVNGASGSENNVAPHACFANALMPAFPVCRKRPFCLSGKPSDTTFRA